MGRLFHCRSVLMRTLADVSHNQNGLSASQIAFNAVNELQTEDLPMRWSLVSSSGPSDDFIFIDLSFGWGLSMCSCMEREGSRDKNPNIIAGDFGLQMKLKSIVSVVKWDMLLLSSFLLSFLPHYGPKNVFDFIIYFDRDSTEDSLSPSIRFNPQKSRDKVWLKVFLWLLSRLADLM